MTEERDSRIKKKIFPISTFVLSFLVFAILTTIEMKIIGNYIDSAEIPKKLIVGIFIFWMLGAAFLHILQTGSLGRNIRSRWRRFQ